MLQFVYRGRKMKLICSNFRVSMARLIKVSKIIMVNIIINNKGHNIDVSNVFPSTYK